jgi:uncharacterized UPF0160 family protein
VAKFKKGITHSGRVHLDECMAYAALEYLFGEFEVERKPYVTQKEIVDPGIIIFDIGKMLNRKLNCYDHHQDEKLPSACVLVWQQFAPTSTPEEILIKVSVYDKLLRHISDNDTGKVVSKGLSLSRAFNMLTFQCKDQNEAFDEGVNLCRKILRGLVARIWHENILVQNRWDKGSKKIGKNGAIVLLDKAIDFLPDNWQQLAKDDGALFVIAKDKRTSWTNMYAVNGVPIPKDLKRQSFWENGKKAAYKNDHDAVNHAIEMSINSPS